MKNISKKILYHLQNLQDWKSFNGSILYEMIGKSFSLITLSIKSRSNNVDIFFSILLLIPFISIFQWEVRAFWDPSLIGVNYIWSQTDWFTSYAGGFVRRGLSGEILEVFANNLGIQPFHTLVISGVIVYTVLMGWALYLFANRFPIFFIVSPLFLGAAIYSKILFNKDLFLILLCLFALYTIISNIGKIKKFIFINSINTFALLIHEVYFFFCIPLQIAIFNLHQKKKLHSFTFLPYFAVQFIVMLTLSLNLGTEEMVMTIINQWNSYYKEVAPEYCCFEFKYYFYWLAKSWFPDHLNQQIWFWTAILEGFIWLPALFFIFWLLNGLFIAKFIQHYEKGRECEFLKLYLFITIFSLPVYILAWDYGRFIIMTGIISLFATYLIRNSVQLPLKFEIPFWKSKLTNIQKFCIVMFFTIPVLWPTIEIHLLNLPLSKLIFVFFP